MLHLTGLFCMTGVPHGSNFKFDISVSITPFTSTKARTTADGLDSMFQEKRHGTVIYTEPKYYFHNLFRPHHPESFKAG